MRGVKRRVTLGQAEVREYRVQAMLQLSESYESSFCMVCINRTPDIAADDSITEFLMACRLLHSSGKQVPELHLFSRR